MTESADDFVRSLRPVIEELGGTLVPNRSARLGDFPVDWRGEIVAYVRRPELHNALGRLIASVEREFACTLAEMNREQKQQAVRQLDEHGAFLLRGAVDDVAHIMGVSRVTLYSYINAISS